MVLHKLDTAKLALIPVNELLFKDDFSKTKLADLSKGNYFGEMSFLINHRRSCSAISLGFTSLYYITQEDFIAILKEKPKEYVINSHK